MTDPIPQNREQADHAATQTHVKLLTNALRDLPLDQFIRNLDQSETLASITDPTLYREALQSGKLDLVRDLARALRGAQIKIHEAEARYLERQPS